MAGTRHLLSLACLLLCGCTTANGLISGAARSERLHREIVSLNSQIKDDLQVLVFAALERCQNPTTRNCLSTVLEIIGQPDPMERAYALALEEPDLNSICDKSKDAQRRLERARDEFVQLQEKSSRHLERASADHFFMAKIRSGAKWAVGILVLILILKKF